MPKKTTSTKPREGAPAGRARRLARTIARSTAIAAGIAATQLAIPEVDPRFHLFNPGLLDRLNAPISRYHE